jgi:hypothetical protein
MDEKDIGVEDYLKKLDMEEIELKKNEEKKKKEEEAKKKEELRKMEAEIERRALGKFKKIIAILMLSIPEVAEKKIIEELKHISPSGSVKRKSDDNLLVESESVSNLKKKTKVVVPANDNNNGDERPLCKYGATCYRKNPQHLKEFRHPTKENSSQNIDVNHSNQNVT